MKPIRRLKPGRHPTTLLLVGMMLVSWSCSTGRQRTFRPPSPVSRVKFDTPGKKLQDALDGLTRKISGSMTDAQKTHIAVVDFCDLKRQTSPLGRFLAEELTTRLFETGKFHVVERALLYKVAEEQQLSLNPMLDPSTAEKLGKILGADAIVTGTIADLKDSYRLNARIIGTEQGLVFAAASANLPKEDSLRNLDYY